MVLWDQVAAEVANDFPDVKWDKMLVDAMTCRMVLDPKSLDTIVATNLVPFLEIPFYMYLLTLPSMPTFSPILLLLLLDQSALRPPATWTRRARILGKLLNPIMIAPSTHCCDSMFEPIHGSAFDIAGKGVANPVATFWTAAEMLTWLGEEKAAKRMMDAVEAVTERGIATRDLGGSADTKQVTDAVCQELEKVYGNVLRM